jgi:hypothetical protein
MNPQTAGRVAAQLRKRYPGADIRVTPQATGLHVHMRTASGSTVDADIGDRPSAIIAALLRRAYAPRRAQQAGP